MTSPRLCCALLLGLLFSAANLHGQGTETPAPLPADSINRTKLLPFPGLRYGSPLGFSFYGGVMLGWKNPVGYSGPTFIAEVGQDGVRASLGASMVGLGLGTQRAQLSYIRTWDDHGDVRADQTYIGPEIAAGLLAGVTVGHYWRISDGGGKARIFSVGSFIGF